jgi:heptosyltransferase III
VANSKTSRAALAIETDIRLKLPRRILVFRVGHLGDTIVALPAIWAIRRAFQNAHITLLSNQYSSAIRVSPEHVLPAQGLIDDILKYPSSNGRRNMLGLFRLWLLLRSRRFDTLVYLAPRLRKPRSVRRDLRFFQLAGINRVIGDKGFEPLPPKGETESLPVVEHEVDHLLRRLFLSDVPIPERREVNIDLALTEVEHSTAGAWLGRQVPAEFLRSKFVGFGPGSKCSSKIWPENRFVDVGCHLIKELNIYPIVFGGPEDRQLGDRLIAAWGRGANAAGKVPVRLSAAILASCELYVGNDTGTMHLAAAVGTRCVVAMAAVDWPGRWNPYGSGHTVLRSEVSCAGCRLEICTVEGLRCLKDISVTAVVGACQAALKDTPGNSLIVKEERVAR